MGLLRRLRLPQILDGLSQRSIINVDFLSVGQYYRFINHWMVGEQFGPSGNSWGTGSTLYTQIIDGSGLPVVPTGGSNQIGSGISIPASWQYGEVGSGQYYVFAFDGNGQFDFNASGFTYVAGPVTGAWGTKSSSNVTEETSSRWRTTGSATSTYMIFSYTGQAQIFAARILANDNAGIGATGNIRNIRFYRLDDESDLLAGNIFRMPYKQQLKDLCPAALRFMDWHGGNNNRGCRFEDRTLPNYSSFSSLNGSGSNWVNSPAYGAISFVDAAGTANQYACDAVTTGTTGNPRTMPVSLTQGEICTTRIDSSQVRCGQQKISAISSASPGMVTVSAAITGDVTSGSQEIPNISPSDMQKVSTGMRAFGTGIPSGSVVWGVDIGSNRIFITPAATATNAGVSLTFGHGFNAGDIVVLQFNYLGDRIGTFTSGSSQITLVNDLSGVVAGMRVDSPLVPSGRTVVSVDGSNPDNKKITMSDTASVSTTSGGDFLSLQAMPKLHNVPCQITLDGIDPDHKFSLADLNGDPIDTTGMGTFPTVSVANVTHLITLNVGDRGAYPLIFPGGGANASTYGNGYLIATKYNSFMFDKTISAMADGAGNEIFGVWSMCESPSNNVGHDGGGVPLEICTALVNEVNALGPARPIHMYVNIPHLGISTMDPDYQEASNWGIGLTNVILNGANGFAGLTSVADLFIAYSNETWNTGSAWTQTFWCGSRGHSRWGAASIGDFVDMACLRSNVAMDDIRNSDHYTSRVKFVLEGQGTYSTTAGGLNQLRIDGSYFQINDASNPGGTGGAPMVIHDYYSVAGYFEVGETFDTANLSTLVASWVSNIGNPTAQEADCAAYVEGLVNFNNEVNPTNGSETTWRYGKQIIPALASYLNANYGKSIIMYEGGWNKAIKFYSAYGYPYVWATFDGSTSTITGMDSGVVSTIPVGDFVFGYGVPANTRVDSKPGGGTSLALSNNTTVALTWGQILTASPESAFLWAVKHSEAWKDAYLQFLEDTQIANSGMAADYIQCHSRWGHIWPSAYGFSNAEWDGMTPLMYAEGDRNRALSN